MKYYRNGSDVRCGLANKFPCTLMAGLVQGDFAPVPHPGQDPVKPQGKAAR
jgi:hypothetical protein